MKKSTYLIIEGIISFGFLKNNLLPFINNDILLLLALAWNFWGFFYFKGNGVLYTTKNITWVLSIMLVFFLCTLYPTFHYWQPYLSTLVAMRANLIVLFLLTLLKISPSEEEFIYSFKVLAYIALVFGVLAFTFPFLFVSKEDILRLIQRQKTGSSDILTIWPGSACAVFYFYILLQNMINKKALKSIVLCTIFMLYIVLMQNRSTLLCAAPFYFYGLIKTDFRYKYIFISVVVFALGVYTYSIFDSLIDETIKDLSNDKYNRWQSMEYFMSVERYDLLTFLFGHGIPASDSAYLHEMRSMFNPALNRFVIISDIGLFGSMYFYGIILILILYRFIFKAIFIKQMPMYLKFYAIWILLVPTIHSFAINQNFSGTMNFLIFIYLVLLNEQYLQNGQSNIDQ